MIRNPDTGMKSRADVCLEHLSRRSLVLGVCCELPDGFGIIPQGEGVEPLCNADSHPSNETGHPRHLSSDCRLRCLISSPSASSWTSIQVMLSAPGTSVLDVRKRTDVPNAKGPTLAG